MIKPIFLYEDLEEDRVIKTDTMLDDIENKYPILILGYSETGYRNYNFDKKYINEDLSYRDGLTEDEIKEYEDILSERQLANIKGELITRMWQYDSLTGTVIDDSYSYYDIFKEIYDTFFTNEELYTLTENMVNEIISGDLEDIMYHLSKSFSFLDNLNKEDKLHINNRLKKSYKTYRDLANLLSYKNIYTSNKMEDK